MMLQTREASAVAALGLIVFMSSQFICCQGVFGDPAAKPTATKPAVERPALGDIEVSDYCTVLLAPKLRTQLGANEAQREALEDMNTQLKTRMDNCATAVAHGPSGLTPGMISARIKYQMAEFGRKVRDTLTP